MPRLPPGSDEYVVKVAWERPKEAASTWKSVSHVFDGATAVLRKEFKALRLEMDQAWKWIRSGDSYSGMGCVLIILRIVVWGGSRASNC